ncbi:MAG: threonylcarbamoyl-AMP synthase [Clostridia bacterium]|nr:threonylcarbamoyl-AMP synthase [Clostridia bacterium]
METLVGKEEIIDTCAKLIQKGEIVAFPTETVYGLGGNALSDSAVEKIYIAKNRPADNPFIVHVPNVEEAMKYAEVTEDALKIFDRFSPGPITVVLKKKSCIVDRATANLDTVGIRIPSHPICQEFLKECKLPIAAPSANISKKVSPTTFKHVYEDMNGKIAAIIDGGDCEVGIESTVISLAGETPIVLRPGGITIEELSKVLPNVKGFTGVVKVAQSPGMKYTHYCPTVPCVLYSNRDNAIKEYIKQKENNPVILAINTEAQYFKDNNINSISLGETYVEYAHNIFKMLRECEKKYGYIIVQALGDTGIEKSIMNRILKSSGGKIV